MDDPSGVAVLDCPSPRRKLQWSHAGYVVGPVFIALSIAFYFVTRHSGLGPVKLVRVAGIPLEQPWTRERAGRWWATHGAGRTARSPSRA